MRGRQLVAGGFFVFNVDLNVDLNYIGVNIKVDIK
jgi:hypothetical protein